MTPWNDRSLQVASDTMHRARYRLLQSWWREHVLGLQPGFNGRQYVGSLLAADAPPDANYLTDEVRAYAAERVQEIQAEGGTVNVDRLRRNLLSSQPLCFNIFGHLQAHPGAAAAVLSDTFGVAIDEIVHIEVEWAPLRRSHLGDRTAFDAIVDFRAGGRRRFLAIEMKYTESFSQRMYDRPEYRQITAESGAFAQGAADRLVAPATNQLWRQTLLTLSLAATGEYDGGQAAVLSLEHDAGVQKAVAGLAAEAATEAVLPAVGSLERLVTAAGGVPELSDWAASLRTRYLDTSPLEG